MAQPTFFLQECQPWLQLPPFFAQCPNWGIQVPILKDLSQTYSSCNKNTKTTTLLLQHIGSPITVIFLHYILQEFCSGLPRLSTYKSTMWYAKRLVTITKYFFMVKIRTKQSLLGFQKWSHDFTLALRCKMSNRALPKAWRTQGIEPLNLSSLSQSTSLVQIQLGFLCRHEICQKIYTIRFLGQKFVHTKSEKIATIFTHNETAQMHWYQ